MYSFALAKSNGTCQYTYILALSTNIRARLGNYVCSVFMPKKESDLNTLTWQHGTMVPWIPRLTPNVGRKTELTFGFFVQPVYICENGRGWRG
jgi:hypothetical protein